MVPVLDINKQPLMPCSEKRARRLMEKGEAKPFWNKGFFCIILQKEPSSRKKIIHYDQYMILYWKADRSESLTKSIDVPESHPGFEWKCNHDIAYEMFLQLNPNVDPNLILSVSYC